MVFNTLVRSALIGLCFAVSTANAYIPQSRTIIGRLARNQGKGAYQIDQEVEFKTADAAPGTPGETFKVRERWIVDGGSSLRLSVSGNGAKFEAVYRGRTRVAPDFKGGWSNANASTEFLEPFFHTRTSVDLIRLMTQAGLVSNSFARERAPFNPNAKNPYPQEPNVRLGRVDGVITYAFGIPVVGDENKPGVWIEQDSFLLKKLRFPSNAEMVASQHTVYDSSLKFPKERKITWNGRLATVRVLSVKSIPAPQAQKLLASTTLSANDAREANLPDAAKEFYSRFR